MNNRIALLVLSCDKYSSLWSILSQNYSLLWTYQPYDAFILSNYKEYKDEYFTTLPIGKDVSWSQNLILGLEKLKKLDYKYVLTSFDDLFINKFIIQEDLNILVNEFISNDGNVLQLVSKKRERNRLIGYYDEIKNNSLYRASCVFTIWNISTLLNLLDSKESAWEFEKKGSVRSQNIDKIYVVKKSIVNYINLIVKGKILLSSYYRLKLKKVNLNNLDFNKMSFVEYVKHMLWHILANIFRYIIPTSFQSKLLKIINRR